MAIETPGRKGFGDIAPAFADYTDRVLFGEIWERPGLSKRDRSLITVATCRKANNKADRRCFRSTQAPIKDEFQTPNSSDTPLVWWREQF